MKKYTLISVNEWNSEGFVNWELCGKPHGYYAR